MILRQFNYSDTKLKASDRFAIWSDRELSDSKRKKLRDLIRGNDDALKKRAKKKAKIITAVGTGLGTVAGGLLGKSEGLKGIAKGAAIGSGVGGAFGGTLGLSSYAGNRVGSKLRRKMIGKIPNYKEYLERRGDQLDVASGRLSEDGFAKKWYKD